VSDFIKNDIPEIDLKIISFPVKAKSRKLRATWTVETAQELQALHSVDLFRWILEINGKQYLNEKYKEEYEFFKLPIARIVCRIQKKEK
jgi:hypothetical protein